MTNGVLVERASNFAILEEMMKSTKNGTRSLETIARTLILKVVFWLVLLLLMTVTSLHRFRKTPKICLMML